MEANSMKVESMPSQEYELFKWSCFDRSFHAVHDGLNVDALLSLTGEELERAEELLLVALPYTTDCRPFQAAGYLKLTAARPDLAVRFASETEPEHVRAWSAWALYQMDPRPEYPAYLTEAAARSKKAPFHHEIEWCDQDCRRAHQNFRN
jgi:hypothetical protein